MGPPSADFPRALATAASIFAALLALATGAVAEPQAPSDEEDPDIAFAEGFVGTIYQGDLELDGWTDLGGGLVAPPIFVRHYQREADGIYLALTAKEVAKASSDIPARFEVTDTLIVPPPQGGAQFTVSCVKGKDEMLRYLGVAKGREDREWWTDVRSAWEISIETGTIEPTKTKGVRCTNVSWGQ